MCFKHYCIQRPYGRAADPGTIRGRFARENHPRWVSKLTIFGPFREPKVTRSRQSGALRGLRHPQRVPRTAQELPLGTQSGPRDPSRVPNGPPTVPLGRHWAPFGGLWWRFGGLLGSFWTSLGVYVATFRVKRLNHGKPRILLEKRSSDAHGGG